MISNNVDNAHNLVEILDNIITMVTNVQRIVTNATYNTDTYRAFKINLNIIIELVQSVKLKHINENAASFEILEDKVIKDDNRIYADLLSGMSTLHGNMLIQSSQDGFASVTKLKRRLNFADEILYWNDLILDFYADCTNEIRQYTNKKLHRSVSNIIADFEHNVEMALVEIEQLKSSDETNDLSIPEIVREIFNDIDSADTFYSQYYAHTDIVITSEDRMLMKQSHKRLVQLVEERFQEISHGLTRHWAFLPLTAALKEFYQSPAEAFVSLDVGDRKRLVKVSELFVNLAIVEEESQRLHEKMELERAEEEILLSEPQHNNNNNNSMIGNAMRNNARSLMNAARNALNADSRGVMHDSEDIYSAKVAVKPEQLFAEHALANGKKVSPKDVLLLGRAGVGKTTLCRYLTFQWATDNLWSVTASQAGYTCVFYVRLKEVANQAALKSEHRIHMILYHSLWKHCGVDAAQSETLWSNVVESTAPVLFVLDGYDEVAEERHVACEALMQIRSGEYAVCSHFFVLTTSRPHAKISKQVDLVLEDVGFLDEDIPNYIQKYFTEWNVPEGAAATAKDSSVAALLSDWLKQRPNVHQICHVPINLELLCRYLLKKLGAEEFSLFSAQHTEKTLHKHILTHYHCQNALIYLEELAFVGFKTRNLILTADLFVQLTAKHGERFQQSISHFSQTGFLKAVGTVSFNANEVDSGAREYYFIHLSFQEYLTARHFARLIMTSGISDEERAFIVLNKHNPRYMLVWTYVSGVLAGWENLHSMTGRKAERQVSHALRRYFEILLKSHRDLYGVYELELLVRCAEEAKWHHCAMSTELLSYLGSWVMSMAHLKKDRDQNPLLRHLSQLFISCPLAMAKVQYGGKTGLFNFLTQEASYPRWLEKVLWYVNKQTALMDNFTNMVVFCGWYQACRPACCQPQGCFHPTIMRLQRLGNAISHCWERVTEFCKPSSDPFAALLEQYPTGHMHRSLLVAKYAFLTMKFVFLLVGIAVIGPLAAVIMVVCIAAITVYALIGLSILMLSTGGVFFFVVIGMEQHYSRMSAMLTQFMSKFRFTDVQTVTKLVALIESSDAQTAVRIVRSINRSNFSAEMAPLVRKMLHNLVLSRDINVKMTAFLAYVRFLNGAGRQTYNQMAEALSRNEDLLVFNCAVYQQFKERYRAVVHIPGYAAEDSTGRSMDAQLFLAKTYNPLIVTAVNDLLSVFLVHRRLLGPMVFPPRRLLRNREMKSFVKSHFCSVLKKLFDRHHIDSRAVDLICQWQYHTMRSGVEVKTLYRREDFQPPPNFRRSMLNANVFIVEVVDAPPAAPVAAPAAQTNSATAPERRTVRELLGDLSEAGTVAEQMRVLQLLLKVKDMSGAERHDAAVLLLNTAYWSSWRRDLFLIFVPIIVVHGIILALIGALFSEKFWFPLVPFGSVFLEALYHDYNPWDARCAGNMLSQDAAQTRSISAVVLLLVVKVLDTAAEFVITYFDSNFGCCFKYNPQAFLNYYFSFAVQHMLVIELVHMNLAQPAYFVNLLENYPYRCCFNASDALRGILRENLSQHHTAIWSQSGRSRHFCWYDGRELREFYCFYAVTLRHDIDAVRPMKECVHVPVLSVSVGELVWRAISAPWSQGHAYIAPESSAEAETVATGDPATAAHNSNTAEEKFAAHWAECEGCLEQFVESVDRMPIRSSLIRRSAANIEQ